MSSQEAKELNSDQTGSLNARTNDSRSSARDAEMSYSEFTVVSQGHVTSQTCGRSNPTEPSTENVAFDEGSTHNNDEPERTAGRRRNDLEQPGAYQLVDGRRHTSESGEMSTSIHGDQLVGTSEGSCPVQEKDSITGLTASAHARKSFQMDNDDSSGHSICDGGDGNVLLQEDQVEQDVRTERPEHQPFPQQEGGTQVNGLSVPIQETELCRLRESVTCDQGCALSHPLQETEQPAAGRPSEPSGLLACQQPRDDGSVNVVSSLGQIEQPIEHACERQEIRLWKGQIDRSASQKAARNKKNPRETYFIVKYTEVGQLRQASDNGFIPAVFSSAIDSDSFEYKFGVRMYPNGVGEGRGKYVAIFVHIMEGEHDDFLSWPYTGRITLSVLDRSGNRHNDISHTLQAKPTLAAFQRPLEAIFPMGYGFICFARIELFFGPQFVKNDELFLKIEFSIK